MSEDLMLLKKLCSLDEENVYLFMRNTLTRYYSPTKLVFSNEYIIAEGDLPFCLVAHMDTIFSQQPGLDDFIFDQEKEIMWAPHGAGFDDRVGLWMIIKLISMGYKPSLVLTLGEEWGGLGAKQLRKDYPDCPFPNCKALIQLDRANRNDSVYYDCDNKEFEKFINSFGFETKEGTFTDISFLSPAWEIASVNLSVGYIEEHTPNERLNYGWTKESLTKVKQILDASETTKSYSFIPKKINLNWRCDFCGIQQNTPLKKFNIIEDGELRIHICEHCKKVYGVYNKI